MAEEHFGADLLIYRSVIGSEAQRGEPDLQTRPGHRRPEDGAPFRDLSTVTGKENLRQALVNRLLTRRGELAPLGHPTYGSRLYTLIGRPNNETGRNLAKLFVLETLAEEPRIETRLTVRVTPDVRDRTLVHIDVEARPVGEDEPLLVALAFSFEGL